MAVGAVALAGPGNALATVNWGPGGAEVKTGSVPFGGAMDAGGNIYTANYGSSSVTRVTPAGIPSGSAGNGYSWGTPLPGPWGPCKAAVDSSGKVYVVTTGGNQDPSTPEDEGSVMRFTPDGNWTVNWGPAGAAVLIPPGSCGITVDQAGNVYTTDGNSDSVTKITPGGVVTTGWANTGDEPGAITVDASGNLYTANAVGTTYTDNGVGGSVTKISSSGVSSGNAGNGYRWAGVGSGPTAIAVDSSGNVFTTNQNSNTVTRITPSGVSSGSVSDGYRWFSGGGSNPLSVATDSTGSVYVGYHGTDDAWKVTPSGTPTRLGATGDNPFWIGVDSFGNAFTINGASNVSKFANVPSSPTPPAPTPSDPTPTDPTPSSPAPVDDPPAQPKSPAKPIGAWPATVRDGKVAALIEPAAGVRYSISATNGKRSRAGACRNVKVKEGRNKVTRVSCSVALPRGTWRVSIIPTLNGVPGTPISRTYRVR
ncbi:MAG: hypothetical protein KGR19_01260 [Acidobacteria bacterium]|nr:hypothetical protein [Acidobacteriota bacterium]